MTGSDAASASVGKARVLKGDNEWDTGVGGSADRKSLSRAAGPTSPAVRWHGGMPSLLGEQPVIANGIVVSARVAEFGPDGSWVVTQELQTGAERWRVQLPVNFPDSWASRVSAVNQGRVYATRAGNSNQEYLYALDTEDGSILWQSEALTNEYVSDSLTFTAKGDPVVSGAGTLTRIDREDGHTVWSAPCQCAGMATVSGNHVYTWDFVSGYVIHVFDAETGNPLYASAPLAFGLFPAGMPIIAAPDGSVYASTTEPSFVAFQDTGSAVVARWQVPLADVAFGSFGIGPDRSVYTYGTGNVILRLNPDTGAVLNTSMPIPSFGGGLYGPRMAIDSAGRLFVTADAPLLPDGHTSGMLYAFNADLTLRWQDRVADVNLGGPAIGPNGTLVVCGDEVRAYKAH